MRVARSRPRRSDRIRPCCWRCRSASSSASAVSAVERHHAGIAQRDRALGFAGVGLLADRDERRRPRRPAARSRSDRRRGNRARRSPRRRAAARAAARTFRREISGVSPNATSTSSAPVAIAARAASTACAVPRRSDWTNTVASGRTRNASAVTAWCSGPTTTASAAPSPFGAAVRTCPSNVRPATSCSTFGSEERIRVPSPAASTIVRLVRPVILRSSSPESRSIARCCVIMGLERCGNLFHRVSRALERRKTCC